MGHEKKNAWLACAAINGLLAVLLGAMAAHGLEDRLDAKAMAYWETASRYQMYHALALFAVAWLAGEVASKAVRVAGIAFLLGILLFCGSLYLLALTGTKGFGMVTPFGGVAFLVAWVALFVLGLRGMKKT